MKRFISLSFVVLFLVCGTLQAKLQVDCKGKKITLSICKDNLVSEKDLFIRSFSEAYKNIPLDVLKVESLPKFLNAAFEDEETDFANKKADTLFISAKDSSGKLVGFVSFDKNSDHVYIRALAIDPSLWLSGIGKSLVFCALNSFRDCRCLKLVTRRVNAIARGFYSKIGFTESAYIHSGLSPERYIGYEISFDDIFAKQTLQKYEQIN